jgi:hypothetical protein
MPHFVEKEVCLTIGGKEAARSSGPARGGAPVMVFHADGSVTVTAPGASDRPEQHVGQWTGDPGDPDAVSLELEGHSYSYRIEERAWGFSAIPRR